MLVVWQFYSYGAPLIYKDLSSSCSPLLFGVGVGVGVGVGAAFTISPTAVTCWVCFPSPIFISNSRVQQKLGVVALPYTSMFTLSNTAVTCWVCFPSPVLMSSSRVEL